MSRRRASSCWAISGDFGRCVGRERLVEKFDSLPVKDLRRHLSATRLDEGCYVLADARHPVGFHERAVLPDAARVLAVHIDEGAGVGQERCHVLSPRLQVIERLQREFVPCPVTGDDDLSCLEVAFHPGSFYRLFDKRLRCQTAPKSAVKRRKTAYRHRHSVTSDNMVVLGVKRCEVVRSRAIIRRALSRRG